jgi:hypothetical protein
MKHLNLLFLIVCLPCLVMGQNTYKTVVGSGDQLSARVLTNYRPGKLIYNYKNCHFTIKAGKWAKRNSEYFLAVTATVTNASSDTLFYEWDSDSWRDHFLIDTTSLKIDDPNAHHISDIDGSDVVLPYKSLSYEIELTPKVIGAPFYGQIKIGLRLLFQRHAGSDVFGIVADVTSKKIIRKYNRDLRKRIHTLWSNAVDI